MEENTHEKEEIREEHPALCNTTLYSYTSTKHKCITYYVFIAMWKGHERTFAHTTQHTPATYKMLV